MTWIYENEPVTEVDPKYIGFIYRITNLIDGRMYIGKKKSTFKKTSIKTVKLKNGEKRKKKIRSLVPSDWDTYYGSSEELKKDVETLGKENFKREITRWCRTLTELTYFEAREQFVSDCLLYPDKFYNAWISCRTRRDHLLKYAQNESCIKI
jgi:hypothetical protein